MGSLRRLHHWGMLWLGKFSNCVTTNFSEEDIGASPQRNLLQISRLTCNGWSGGVLSEVFQIKKDIDDWHAAVVVRSGYMVNIFPG